MNKRAKGEVLEPVLILIGLLIIIFLYVLPVGPNKISPSNSTSSSAWDVGGAKSYRSDTNSFNADSLYSNAISLGSGNASYESDPVEEYITIYNNGSVPTTISGWFLTNAKGTKPYTLNGQLQYSPSDQATIPQGTAFLTANGQNTLGAIVLKPGDTAVVTTGYIGSRSRIPIVSFKVNKCSGYLEADADYTLTPPLRKNCVRPSEEPGFNLLEEECQEFIEGMNYCHIPDFETRDIYGESCHNCVDGRSGLSRSCIAFLKSHYSYAGCLVYHGGDSDFLGREWRIFLSNKWELWGAKKETISLFDQFGKAIDYLSY